MRKKLILCLSLILVQTMFLSGCGFSTRPLIKAGFTPEKVTVELEGVTGTYNLLLLADLHMIADTDEVSEAELANVENRKASLFNNSVLLWDRLPKLIDDCGADYLLLAGDLIDFNSQANIRALSNGLADLKTPFVYVRGDHDSQPYFMSDTDAEKARIRQNGVYNNEGAFYVEFEEFTILALNNSTEQVTEEALSIAKEAIALGKPIILLTHVPLDSYYDGTLRETSALAKNGRYLLWSTGGECEYYPSSTTHDFLDLIYDENSLVKEVLCGHLHLAWDGQITNNTHEHVFAPAFSGYVGAIEVKGK